MYEWRMLSCSDVPRCTYWASLQLCATCGQVQTYDVRVFGFLKTFVFVMADQVDTVWILDATIEIVRLRSTHATDWIIIWMEYMEHAVAKMLLCRPLDPPPSSMLSRSSFVTQGGSVTFMISLHCALDMQTEGFVHQTRFGPS